MSFHHALITMQIPPHSPIAGCFRQRNPAAWTTPRLFSPWWCSWTPRRNAPRPWSSTSWLKEGSEYGQGTGSASTVPPNFTKSLATPSQSSGWGQSWVPSSRRLACYGTICRKEGRHSRPSVATETQGRAGRGSLATELQGVVRTRVGQGSYASATEEPSLKTTEVDCFEAATLTFEGAAMRGTERRFLSSAGFCLLHGLGDLCASFLQVGSRRE